MTIGLSASRDPHSLTFPRLLILPFIPKGKSAFAMWNMGAAFLVGVVLDNSMRRGWLKI